MVEGEEEEEEPSNCEDIPANLIHLFSLDMNTYSTLALTPVVSQYKDTASTLVESILSQDHHYMYLTQAEL